MLQALIWTFVATAGLLLAALALPIRIGLEAGSGPPRRVKLRLMLFGGALPLPAIRLTDRIGPDRPKRPKRRKRKPGRTGPEGRRAAVRLARVPVRAALADLRRGLRLRKLRIDGRIGLGDPADTGRLWGWLAPVIYGLPRPHQAEISLVPSFDRPAVEGDVSAEGRIWLPPLVVLGLRILWAIYGPRPRSPAAA